MDTWVPLSRFSAMAGVPEATCRRYLASGLSKFFRTRKEARLNLVHVEDVQILKRAYQLSGLGKKMDEIEGALSIEFKKIIDVSEDNDSKNPLIENKNNEVAIKSSDSLVRLIDCMERMIINQEQTIQEMRRQNEILLKLVTGNGDRLENAPRSPQETQKEIKRGNVHDTEPEATGEPDMTREDKVRLVHELHAAGKGGRATASELNRRGIRTLSGNGRWAAGSVKRILRGAIKQ
jgi:hypothetical protein